VISRQKFKLRNSSFFPELVQPRRRVDKVLWAATRTAYVASTSTRDVDVLVKALGCESGVSESTVSRICQDIREDVAELFTRRLDGIPFVCRWLDVTCLKVREIRRIVSEAVVIATAVRGDVHREVVGGGGVGDLGNETFCTEFLRDRTDRGLTCGQLAILCAYRRLTAASSRVMQGNDLQRYRNHAMRNLPAAARHKFRQLIAALIRAVFAQLGHDRTRARHDDIVRHFESFDLEVARASRHGRRPARLRRTPASLHG
jgi:putative transposase